MNITQIMGKGHGERNGHRGYTWVMCRFALSNERALVTPIPRLGTPL